MLRRCGLGHQHGGIIRVDVGPGQRRGNQQRVAIAGDIVDAAVRIQQRLFADSTRRVAPLVRARPEPGLRRGKVFERHEQVDAAVVATDPK